MLHRAAVAVTVPQPSMLGSAQGIAIQPVMPDGGGYGKNKWATTTEAMRNRGEQEGRCSRTLLRLLW